MNIVYDKNIKPRITGSRNKENWIGEIKMDKKDLAIIGDSEYKKLLLDLKEKVRCSQLKAAVKVNYELLDLYWNLGKEIVEKQKDYSWGDRKNT